MKGTVKIVLGGILMVGAFIMAHLPVSGGISISAGAGMCSSIAGTIAQSFSTQANVDCGKVADLMDFFWAVGIVGAVLIAWGIIGLLHPAPPKPIQYEYPDPENF